MTASGFIPCARCDADMERKPLGRLPRFCASCQRERRLERQIGRDRETAALRRDIMADFEHWRDAHEYDPDGVDYLYPQIDEFVAALADYDNGLPAVADAMPTGAYSPAGPDEGYSTFFADLAVELYGDDGRGGLAARAASHPWHAANPHWAYPFSRAEASEYFAA